jgi:ADP-ribose pyrophosphatase YjhB (NUDIX family)
MRFGAGALLFHERSVLLGRRSLMESEPLTWACFGGGGERGEDHLSCMIREVHEEANIDVRGQPSILIDEYREPNFTFYTYAVLLEEPVTPVLTPETIDAAWFPLGPTGEMLWAYLPKPLLSGMTTLVTKPLVADAVLRLLQPCSRRPTNALLI